LSYRGAILYPWPGTTVDAEGESEKTLFYQVLVDQRDAEELPMEHELLRISDSDREAFDFVSFNTPKNLFKKFSLQQDSKTGTS